MSDPLVAAMRRAIQNVLPRGAFLRRDRGEALFVTDASRRGAAIDWASIGFIRESRDGLDHLTPAPKWLGALEAEYPEPPDPLCAAFQRFNGKPGPEALRLFAAGMKAMDAGQRDASYDRRLRQLAAVTLREHQSGGGLYACALVRYRMEKERL